MAWLQPRSFVGQALPPGHRLSSALQAAAEDSEGEIKRPQGVTIGKEKKSVADLVQGQLLTGTVKNIFRGAGFFIDVGMDRNGLLEVGEILDEGFPTRGRRTLEIGEQITARVLSTEGGLLYLTLRGGSLERPKRFRFGKPDVSGFKSVGPEEWLEVQVDRMQFWGLFVQAVPPGGGEPQEGIIHRDDFGSTIERKVKLGSTLRVRLKSVDSAQQVLAFTTKELKQAKATVPEQAASEGAPSQ